MGWPLCYVAADIEHSASFSNAERAEVLDLLTREKQRRGDKTEYAILIVSDGATIREN
ncbi:hypothetical protein [Ruegeria arenilitoris]|uniref:hypothetical protein n=1 Tax=Ruegeria arenilitoris TaxID=1173585 RepID=UPI001C2C29D3|nr:hypothetical protein [Ruegeria arenilitoris]